MNWLVINSVAEWDEVLSSSKPFAIFKHSTRCAVSSIAKSRVEKGWLKDVSHLPIYILDLIRHREVSNHIAESLNIRHQSPQLIVVKDGKAIFNASHTSIRTSDLIDVV